MTWLERDWPALAAAAWLAFLAWMWASGRRARKHPAAGTPPGGGSAPPPPSPPPGHNWDDGTIYALAAAIDCTACRPAGHGRCTCTRDCGHPGGCPGGAGPILAASYTEAELGRLARITTRRRP